MTSRESEQHLEKDTASTVEYIGGQDAIAVGYSGGQDALITEAEKQAVFRKMDRTLLPMIFVLYSLSVLDRSNLGNAKIAGMQDDIDISGHKYSWLATIFYIAYITFQFATPLWKVFSPHRWIAFTVVFWGTIATVQAATTSWTGMMICRFLLGASEAGFGPGIGLYFSYFYPRDKIGFRLGVFVSGSALANAYGGALAYGLSHINSAIASWRLLFILEGVPTVIVGVLALFIMPDSPRSAKFLSERERYVAGVVAAQQPGAESQEHGLELKKLFAAFKDFRTYCISIMYFSCNVSFASLPLFLPTIIADMGTFPRLAANGLSAPPYFLCFLTIILISFFSDRFVLRGPFIVLAALTAAIGFLILALTTATAPRYFGTFLAVQIFVSVAVILPWVANNNDSDSKRAGGFWIVQAVGQCGPLLGTNVFPESEGPHYAKGLWICCGACVLVAVLASSLSVELWLKNRRTEKAWKDAVERGEVDLERPFLYII